MKTSLPFVLCLLLLGCPSTPEPEPEYSRALPAGQSALVRVSQGEFTPSPGTAFEARDPGLIEAIDQSILWFMAPSSKQFFPFENICTHEQAQASLVAFRELLTSNLSPQEFKRELWRKFEMYRSVGWNGQGTVLFTGYYAPEFKASRVSAPGFEHPLYRRPEDLVTDPNTGRPLGRKTPDGGTAPYPTRRQIEEQGLLEGTELFWLEDEFATYVVQVNGSAKLTLPDGTIVYVGYDGKTDREYKGLGTVAVEEGIIAPENLSLRSLRRVWGRNPQLVRKLMYVNESYVFFTEYDGETWPAGSLGVRVTPQASLATDKKIYPRGGIVLVATTLASTTHGNPEFLRFMLDQDTGGAIRAPGRADIFMGVGPAAETLAGGQYAKGALYYYILKSELIPQYTGGR